VTVAKVFRVRGTAARHCPFRKIGVENYPFALRTVRAQWI